MSYGNGTSGAAGSNPTFTTLTEGQVPKADASQKLVYGGATVDPVTGVTTFDNSVVFPAASADIGPSLRLSEGAGDLVIVDLLKEQMSFSTNSDFSDLTGSSPPAYFDFGMPRVTNVNLDDGTIITANPTNFSLVGTIDPTTSVALVDRATIRTNGPMTNFTMRVIDNATGKIVRHLPSKAAWDGVQPGLTLGGPLEIMFFFAQEGTDTATEYYLGYVPFLVEDGQQLDFSIKADSIDLLGNGAGLPYLVLEDHVGPLVPLASEEAATRAQTTGLLEGGVITQASGTTADWTSGRGLVADYSDPENPVITDVTWDAVAGFTPTNIADNDGTWIGYDSAGSIVEIPATALSVDDERERIMIGLITHAAGAIVGVSSAPFNVAYDGIESFNAFMSQVIGPANVNGNIYGANGANLSIDVIGGSAFILGSNFRNDPDSSDIVSLPSEAAITFFKNYRTSGVGGSVIFETPPTTFIDPTMWDDGSGTLQTVPAGEWTIQRIFRSRADTTAVSYGQETFASQALALEALGSEAFTEKNPLPDMLFRASLVIVESATDLSDSAEAEFFAQSSFRVAGAQSAASTIPGITSPGGVDTSVQFNDAGVFGGNSDFKYDKVLRNLSIRANALGSSSIDLGDGAGAPKCVILYDDTTDDFKITSLTSTKTLALQANVGVGEAFSAIASTLHVYENTATTNLATGLIIEQDGVGDAVQHFVLSGTSATSIGIDNSDGDKFKIGFSQDLGSLNVLSIDPSTSITTIQELNVPGFIEQNNALYNITKTYIYNPSTTSTIYTQYLGTYDVDQPVEIYLGDAGGSHGSSSYFRVTRHFDEAPNIHILDNGNLLSTYSLHYRAINGFLYELFFEDSSSANNNVTYTAYVKYNAVATDSISAANDTGVIELSPIIFTRITAGDAKQVGIGTSNPLTTLDVSGTQLITDDTEILLNINRDNVDVGGTGSPAVSAGILFGVSSTPIPIQQKGAILFERNASFSRGDFVVAINNDSNNDNADVSDEVMRITKTGIVKVPDNGSFALGDSNDFTITHNGTDNLFTAVNGDITFDLQQANTDFEIFLSTDNSLSDFVILNNSLSRIFDVRGDGSVHLNTNVVLNIGGLDELQLVHDSGLGAITNTVGDLIIDNTSATSDILVTVGADTNATALVVRNNSLDEIMRVNGDKTVNLLDGVALNLGDSDDLQFKFDGFNASITSNTGGFTIDNTNSTGETNLRVGSDDSDTAVQMQNNSGEIIARFGGDGLTTLNGTELIFDNTETLLHLTRNSDVEDGSAAAGILFGVRTLTTLQQKAAILFKRTATFGRGELILAVNNSTTNDNATLTDEVVSISAGTMSVKPSAEGGNAQIILRDFEGNSGALFRYNDTGVDTGSFSISSEGGAITMSPVVFGFTSISTPISFIPGAGLSTRSLSIGNNTIPVTTTDNSLSGGTGAEVKTFVSAIDPKAVLLGDSGNICHFVDGVDSDFYLNIGAADDNTIWKGLRGDLLTVLPSKTTTEINAIASPVGGQVEFDTTLGVTKTYNPNSPVDDKWAQSGVDTEGITKINGWFDNATACTFNLTGDLVEATGHPMVNDDKVAFKPDTGTLPANVIVDKEYFVISVLANSFQISLTQGGAAIEFDDAGTAGTKFFDLSDTVNEQVLVLEAEKLHYLSYPQDVKLTVSGTSFWAPNQLPIDDNFYNRTPVVGGPYSGTAVSGNDVMAMNTTVGLVAGMLQIGPNFPANTTISSVDSGVQITLSVDATGSAANAYTYAENKFLENTSNLQKNLFRVRATFTKGSSANVEDVEMFLFNPITGFIEKSAQLIRKQQTSGALTFNINAISDSGSIGVGYNFYFIASDDTTITILDVTRFSSAQCRLR